MRRAAVALAAAVLVLVAAGPAAEAHSDHPCRSGTCRRAAGRITARITTAPDGIRVTATPGTAPALLVERAGPVETLVVLGAAGEPMVRLHEAAAEANVASPTWASTQGVAPEGAERWQPLTTGAALSYVEPRAAVPEAELEGLAERHVLRRWRVPVVVDGRPAEIVGATVWEPLEEGGDSRSSLLWAPIALVALVGGVLLVRRRVRFRP